MSAIKVSIIIRSKNEERWIGSCLNEIREQSYQNFEIILVDNKSTDKTVQKARKYNVTKIVEVTDYLPGKALNIGIKEAVGQYIVCISAHCIPTTRKWLETMVNAIEEDPSFAGVYGRQEPMSFSKPVDKRDLIIVFGLDRKIQKKDSFFHNANSIIRKELWDETPFDNEITNIEDRLWANEMLKKGYKILYEPEASVYHYHGIHQSGDAERLRKVVKIIEERNFNKESKKIELNGMNIVAIVPINKKPNRINNKYQLNYTIDSALGSKYIDRVVVSTDSQETAKIAEKAGAECPFIRPLNLSEAYVTLEKVQQFSLEKIEEEGYLPDLVVHLEETFPYRPNGMIDGMIEHLVQDGYDSVIAAKMLKGYLWQEDLDEGFIRLDSVDVPRDDKQKSLRASGIGIKGLGFVTHPEFIRNYNQIVPNKIGLYEVNHPLAGFEVRSEESAELYSNFLQGS